MTALFRKFTRAAIIGSGVIGRQWAMIFAAAGVRSFLYDVNPEQLHDAMPAIERQLRELAASGHLRGAEKFTDAASRERAVWTQLAHITVATDLDAALFPHACLFPIASYATPVDYVLECVGESLELKREVLAHVDHVLTARLGATAAGATRLPIIASSSATITAAASCARLALRRRTLIAHPVKPPYFAPLVQVVPAAFTESGVAEQTVEWLVAVGQKPVLSCSSAETLG